jgi:hypothetical protein
MKDKTIVDWIEQQMMEGNLSLKEILIQAKEMEKEQEKKTWNDALNSVEKKLELLKQIYGGKNV